MVQRSILRVTIFTVLIAWETVISEPSAHAMPQTFTKCSGLPNPELGEKSHDWQDVQNSYISVYSAYYDERFPAGYIRIIAGGFQVIFHPMKEIYCTLWYKSKGQSVSISVGPALYEVIFESRQDADLYSAHFIRCALPHDKNKEEVKDLGLPYAVSVTTEPCLKVSNELHILYREPPRYSAGFGICYPTLYREYKHFEQIIEMFEIQRVLGARYIIIYKTSIDPNFIQKTLDWYETNSSDDFTVKVLNWSPFERKMNVFMQRAVINECYLRMRSLGVKYISVHDLDELLVPRIVSTYPKLMPLIEDENCPCWYFQHYLHLRNDTLVQETGVKLITQTSLYRTQNVFPAGKIRSKTMYKCDTAISIDLHSPYKTTFNGDQCCLVDPSQGALHHYRDRPMFFVKRKDIMEQNPFIEDTYMKWMNSQLKVAFSSIVAIVTSKEEGSKDGNQGHVHEDL